MMQWDNLKENKCPYCKNDLQDIGTQMACVECLFKIDKERFLKYKNYKKLNWPNLKEGKCPDCGNYLREKEGHYQIMRCSTPECSFSIKEDKMNDIINKPEK